MHPSRSCEEVRRFVSFVGSSSDGHDLIGGPLVTMNLDRYKSLMDGRDHFT